jgi:hypothetical protein
MKKIGLLLTFISIFISCDTGSDKKVLQESNGRMNNLLIVMKNSEWQGEIGDELRKIIAEPVLGLPQPEAQFEVTQVPPESFGSMFKTSRSILHVGIGAENSFSGISNVYAEPQKIITITGKDKESLILEIQKNAKALISGFKTADLLTVQRSIYKNYWDPTKMETFTKNGYSLKIPKTFSKVDDTGDFVWYRMRLDGGNSMELFSYTVPIQSIDDENGNNLVAIRDTIGKKYIPGQVEGSYMITEAAYTPHIFEVKMDGKKAL